MCVLLLSCSYEKGMELCELLLAPCPESCAVLDALASLHVRRGHSDEAVRVWLRALAECPHNAEIFSLTFPVSH